MSIKTLIITGWAAVLSASVGVLAQETGAGDEKPAPACCMPACANHHVAQHTAAPDGAAEAAETPEHAGHYAAAHNANMRCSLTGQTVESCCCTHQDGKLHCTLADKDVDSCCCQPVADKEQARSDEATQK